MTHKVRAAAVLVAATLSALVAIAIGVWVVHVIATSPDAGTAVVVLSFTAVGLFLAAIVVGLLVRIIGLPLMGLVKLGEAAHRRHSAR